MCEPNFKTSHSQLRWPRSDGDPARWPEVNVRSDKDAWFEQCDDSHPKVKFFQKKIGQHLAAKLKLPSPGLAYMDLPKGYKVFVHMQPRAEGPIREDFYIFGSVNANRFRSFPEIQEHIDWLMDTSRPLDDHTTCNCKYNSTSEIALEKRSQTHQTTAKRQLDEEDAENKRQRLESKDDSMSVPERTIDYRTKRRYRKGELIFFRIETIPAPAGSGFPDITHWPGLVSSINHKMPAGDADASMSKAWTMFGAKLPESLQKPPAEKVWVHNIRPLGLFSNAAEVEVLTSEILPWAANAQLLGGPEGWRKIGQEGDRTLNEGVDREAAEDKPQPSDLRGTSLEIRWKRRWGERMKFVDLPRNWDAAVLRLSVGLRVGEVIASAWAQTDKILVIPPHSQLTADDITEIANNRKTLFQGLWLRGERIWLDDFVLLRKLRKDIPRGALLDPSPGAEDRGVLLRIRVIALEVADENDESFAHQKTKNSNDRQQWRCVFYGDLYELAEGEAPESEKPSGDMPPINISAPKGYYFRCLNVNATEVLLDIFDVVGRIYPDLLETDSAYFYSPDDKEKKGRVEAGPTVMSLTGLLPCQDMNLPATVWKDDLYVIVRDATTEIERSVRLTYARKLAAKMGFPAPMEEDEKGEKDGEAKLNGANGAIKGKSNGA